MNGKDWLTRAMEPEPLWQKVLLGIGVGIMTALLTLAYLAGASRASADSPTVGEPRGMSLPACQTEDDDNCWWDATRQGNGEGRSFYVIDGHVTYLDQR